MPPPDPAATILERERSLLASETRAFATRRRRETTRLLAMQSSLFVVLLVAWWAASGTLVDPLFLSDPITVARALLQIAIDGTLWWHLQWTLIEMTLGYALGVAVGLCLAIAVTAIPWGARILRPVMLGLFAIPKVALAPLVIVWFGIYLVPKVILAASLVLFVVYFNTVAGIAAVKLTMHEAVRVMGASRLALLTKLRSAKCRALHPHGDADRAPRSLDRSHHRGVSEQRPRHRFPHRRSELPIRYGAGLRGDLQPAGLRASAQCNDHADRAPFDTLATASRS